MRKQKKQGGFTLVEIAIVMVIIGLLLGGALKGQEMIQNAKTKRVKADFDQYVAAFYSYQDIYRALPGDNKKAKDQHGYGTTNYDGNGDGTVDNADQGKFWANLRAAGLIAGASTDLEMPTNAFAGTITPVSDGAGMGDHSLCFSNIDQKVALIIDNNYDDGEGKTGTIRGVASGALTTAIDYAAGQNIVCLKI